MIAIAIDFDGTIVEHDFPGIGKESPNSIYYIKEFKRLGAEIFLWTVRNGPYLQSAIDFCNDQGIEFDGYNERIFIEPQFKYPPSPKLHADVFIDDRAFGCPMTINPETGNEHVDWDIVGPKVIEMIKDKRNQHSLAIDKRGT